MAKYSVEYKLKIVKQVLSGMAQNEAAKQYGVNKGDVQKWTAAYSAHGKAGLERKPYVHTGQFKQSVVEDMRENGLSCREAAAKHNVGVHSTVSKWERIYLEEGPEGLYEERRGKSSRKKKGRPPKLDKQVEEDLIAENQRLRAEVDYLKKLNALVQKREQREKKPR